MAIIRCNRLLMMLMSGCIEGVLSIPCMRSFALISRNMTETKLASVMRKQIGQWLEVGFVGCGLKIWTM